ncbi:ATP-binding protein [Streptomyces jeddahensis]|uniref:Histidine kinase-, DNA gyrase B-, and HSP90-like ATPase n=1 Tax=Streptomyces jeddahensis TaxID=1716141 RepID=A0A177I0V1_9ACTN|nr:ATP-binding protein [Streptomyces jeddahensis]OAH16028.1 histidine kinase-, DNA gyrase B-, and HSP90-like ATPase [Streptomyces jeddahensis]
MTTSARLGADAAEARPGTPAETYAEAAAGRRFSFELAVHPRSAGQARRLTRARLTGWSVGEETCETAALVVSELVTNALVHTASRVIVCELHDDARQLRISVRDEGCTPGEPHPSPRRPEEEHGRGLLLVEAVSSAWGAQEAGSGLLVWADLPRARDGAPETGTGADGVRGHGTAWR